MLSDTDVENHYNPSTRLVEVDRNGSSSWGFHLTRSKWDPYPWISSVDHGTAAYSAGLKPGDCLLEVNGEDVLGQRVSEVADIVKSKPVQVSLLLWNAGVDPQCTPEAVCCGPMPTNLQRLSACMSTILAFLECPVCLDTIPPPTYQCDNGHLICIRCRTKSERCPVCRLRFTRGRSLLSDQVYNALIDAFNLREEADDARSVKMQQIFKLKNKPKNVPDIKVTQSHTNKFLAKLTAKFSSVDNLNTDSNLISASESAPNVSEFNTNLKTKSLSTNEIFQNDSPAISRSGSTTKLSRNEKNKYLTLNPDNRPASCHGSFESLQRKIDDTPANFNTLTSDDENLFHCPFACSCTYLVKGKNLLEHFQLCHDGPIVQFFKPIVKIGVNNVLKHKKLCYVIQFHSNTFFLKLQLIPNPGVNESSSRDDNILLWTWFLGNKKASKDYDMQVKVVSGDHVILSVRSSVCSLSSTPYHEVKGFKKGVFLSVKTLGALNSSDGDVNMDISIVKSDAE